jgi:hypothetical protein
MVRAPRHHDAGPLLTIGHLDHGTRLPLHIFSRSRYAGVAINEWSFQMACATPPGRRRRPIGAPSQAGAAFMSRVLSSGEIA